MPRLDLAVAKTSPLAPGTTTSWCAAAPAFIQRGDAAFNTTLNPQIPIPRPPPVRPQTRHNEAITRPPRVKQKPAQRALTRGPLTPSRGPLVWKQKPAQRALTRGPLTPQRGHLVWNTDTRPLVHTDDQAARHLLKQKSQTVHESFTKVQNFLM